MKSDLTSYGRRCREHRTRYRLTMADQAATLGCSVAYISLIEQGKRHVPPEHPAKLSHWMSLTDQEAQDLEELALGKMSRINFVADEAIASEFARTIDILPAGPLEKLNRLLASPPLPEYSSEKVREHAQLASSLFNAEGHDQLDILKVIENYIALVDSRFFLSVDADSCFPQNNEAYAQSDGDKVKCIVVSDRLYTTAYRQNPYSRFQLAHEFAHWLLHRRETHAYFRLKQGIAQTPNAHCEREADLFAREIMMPIDLVRRCATPERLARAAGLPLHIAKIRFKELEQILDPSAAQRVRLSNVELKNWMGIQATDWTSAKNDVSPPVDVNNGSIIPFPTYAAAAISTFPTPRKRTKLNQGTGDLFEYASRNAIPQKKLPEDRAKSWFRDNGWRE